jgi:hypothetical protein
MTIEVIKPDEARSRREEAVDVPQPATIFDQASREGLGNRIRIAAGVINSLLASQPPQGTRFVGPEIPLPGRRSSAGMARALMFTNPTPDPAQRGLYLLVELGDPTDLEELVEAFQAHYPVLEGSRGDDHVVFVVEEPAAA